MAAELKHRWKLALATKGQQIAKKSSDPSSALRKRVRPPPPSPLLSSTASAAADSIRIGQHVRVRQPPVLFQQRHQGTTAGLRVVFLKRAIVVSAEDEDGFVEVVYDYGVGGDAFATVRVARDQVKAMPSVSAANSATPAAAAASSDKPAKHRRPTVAGKSLRVLKMLESEMRSQYDGNLAFLEA